MSFHWEDLQLCVFDKRLGLTYMILVHSIVTFEFAVGLQGNIISVFVHLGRSH